MEVYLQPSDINQINLSIIIPVYNEEKNIKKLVEELFRSISPYENSYEILFIDDGSVDGTWSEIKDCINTSSHIGGIRFSRNFGHQHALLAGYTYCTGNLIVSMDGDLQHPPHLIPEMMRLSLQEGYDIVLTKRIDSVSTGWFKRFSSRYFYKIFSYLAEVRLSEGSSDFRLMNRKALNALLQLGDSTIFLRGAVQWIGFKHSTIDYHVQERLSGQSKYNLRRMIKFAITAAISFSNKPLQVGIWLGLFTGMIAFIEIAYVIIRYLNEKTVPGWASLACLISFLFGILFFLLGIIGGYLSNIHDALKKRPRFIIAEVDNVPFAETGRQK
jgi:polyisoprenyl-phosphate glycosyltransferase